MPSFWTRLVAEIQMREIDAWVDSRSLRNPSASCRGKGCKCDASRIHPPLVHRTCHEDDHPSQRDIRVRPYTPVSGGLSGALDSSRSAHAGMIRVGRWLWRPPRWWLCVECMASTAEKGGPLIGECRYCAGKTPPKCRYREICPQ